MQKTKAWKILSNSVYYASVTLTPKPKTLQEKKTTDQDHLCVYMRSHQQNNNKMNPTTYGKNYTLCPNQIYHKYANLVQHLKSINIIQHISRLKKKNYMIVERAYDKIYHLWLEKKTSSNLGIKEKFLRLVKKKSLQDCTGILDNILRKRKAYRLGRKNKLSLFMNGMTVYVDNWMLKWGELYSVSLEAIPTTLEILIMHTQLIKIIWDCYSRASAWLFMLNVYG